MRITVDVVAGGYILGVHESNKAVFTNRVHMLRTVDMLTREDLIKAGRTTLLQNIEAAGMELEAERRSERSDGDGS